MCKDAACILGSNIVQLKVVFEVCKSKIKLDESITQQIMSFITKYMKLLYGCTTGIRLEVSNYPLYGFT